MRELVVSIILHYDYYIYIWIFAHTRICQSIWFKVVNSFHWSHFMCALPLCVLPLLLLLVSCLAFPFAYYNQMKCDIKLNKKTKNNSSSSNHISCISCVEQREKIPWKSYRSDFFSKFVEITVRLGISLRLFPLSVWFRSHDQHFCKLIIKLFLSLIDLIGIHLENIYKTKANHKIFSLGFFQMSGKRSRSFKCAVHHRDREVCSENDFHLIFEYQPLFQRYVLYNQKSVSLFINAGRRCSMRHTS